jgi:hypothetical protein
MRRVLKASVALEEWGYTGILLVSLLQRIHNEFIVVRMAYYP